MATGPAQESPDRSTPADAGALAGRAWLAALPGELAAQRRVMAGLVDRCEAWPLAITLLVGCSLGRGAADALSDIDAALGVDAEPGEAGAPRIDTVEEMMVAQLPELGTLVDVLRHRIERPGQWLRRIFAQFADGTQLDLAITAASQIEERRRAGGAPDFITLYQAPVPAAGGNSAPGVSAPAVEQAAAYAVTGDQVREWAFAGWCALIDADKYLRRGSLWEAHGRLHEARHQIWALWAAAHGAMYPWHGLSQVLDHDPANLPPGIESTVAGLDAASLRRAARASAGILAEVSAAAAGTYPADLPVAMAPMSPARSSGEENHHMDAADSATSWRGQIRHARAGDIDGVAVLAAELASSFEFSAERFRVSYPALLAASGACLLLAADGSETAGYLLGFRHLTFYANGPVAWVEEVGVRGRDRGQGIGRALMGAFEDWAAAEGCVLVALATRRAAPFYLALGYEESATYFRKILASQVRS